MNIAQTKMNIKVLGSVLLGGYLVLTSACSHKKHGEDSATAAEQKSITRATASLFGTNTNPKIKGDLTFDRTAIGGIKLSGTISGLKPRSVHGFHIHENGDCSAPDFSSAGGHLNPAGSAHGAPNTAQSHAGDLGNIKSDKHGNAKIDIDVTGISLATPPNNVVGRALILHAKADDLRTQPTGDSGPRIACGVIAPL